MDPEAYKKYNRKEQGATPGVYKHPNTKDELIAQSHPLADALVRQGWVYDRELPPAEELRRIHSPKEVMKEAPKPEVDAPSDKKGK